MTVNGAALGHWTCQYVPEVLQTSLLESAWETGSPGWPLYLFTIAQNRITPAREWTNQWKHWLCLSVFACARLTWLQCLCFLLRSSYFFFLKFWMMVCSWQYNMGSCVSFLGHVRGLAPFRPLQSNSPFGPILRVSKHHLYQNFISIYLY